MIRPLSEPDLPEARRICSVAFGTFFGAPDPQTFLSDTDYIGGRFGAEHVASFAIDVDGVLAGTNFATRWGNVAFFGPVTVRPEMQGRGAGKALVAAACDAFDAWGVTHGALCTFPQSPLHIALYGKFGFRARFLTGLMVTPSHAAGDAATWTRYGSLSESEQSAVAAASRAITGMLYEGLDLSAEIRTVAARNLGDTLLLWDADQRLAGFAICHWGAASEAGSGICYVKFGAVRPGAGDAQRFGALLDACGSLAETIGMPKLAAGVSLARDEAYAMMLARGFRAATYLVTMHRPNEPAYSRPGLYVLDDLR